MKRTNVTKPRLKKIRLVGERNLRKRAKIIERPIRLQRQWENQLSLVARQMIREAAKEFGKTRIKLNRRGRIADMEMYKGALKFYGTVFALDQMVNLLSGHHLIDAERLNSYSAFLSQVPEEQQRQALVRPSDEFERRIAAKGLVSQKIIKK